MTPTPASTSTPQPTANAILAVRSRLRGPVVRAGRKVLRRRNAITRALHENADGNHLVSDPVFIISSVRSGSTLLRAMLNTHTQICAPHELHLATMEVGTSRAYASNSWTALGVSELDLANLLWDRALHRLLVRSGKRIIVDKTPQNAAVWPRIKDFWPNARYVHLRRHPGSMYQSLVTGTSQTESQALKTILRYGGQLDSARAGLPGPTVRYEDLTADPEGTLRSICDYLDVRYQPRMLNYRAGTAKAGLGDWSANIRSGRIQPARALPALEDLPVDLHELIRSWGY